MIKKLYYFGPSKIFGQDLPLAILLLISWCGLVSSKYFWITSDINTLKLTFYFAHYIILCDVSFNYIII